MVKKELFKQVGRYGTIGLELALSVVIGILFGWWMDGLFGTKPWLTVVFMLFGVAAGFKSLFRLLKDVTRDGGVDQG